MAQEILDSVFSPKFSPEEKILLINDLLPSPDDPTVRLQRADFEKKLNDEVTENLVKDLTDSGAKVNYSMRILVNGIALNLITLSRVKFYLVNRELIQHRYDYKTSSISKSNLKSITEIKYDPVESKERVHPLYDDYVLKLQKAINKQLELLGLLPAQQIERQKIMVIEKMKKRLFEIEKDGVSYSQDLRINMKKEATIPY